MMDRWHALPRLTRVNYIPRVIGFGAIFIAIAWLVVERDWSRWNLPLFGLFFLVYPHIIVLVERWRQSDTSLEHRAMMLDAAMLGLVTVHIHFSGWISYTLLAALILSNTMFGGMRQLLRALAWYLTGILGWGLLAGFRWEPAAPLGIEILTMVALQAYILNSAWVFSIQNQRLVKIKRDAEQKNRLFGSLLRLTNLADGSATVEQLVGGALTEFKQLYPDQSFGFVLRDFNRPETLYLAQFTHDVTVDQKQWVLRRVGRLRTYLPEGYYLEGNGGQDGCFAFLMKARVRHNQGVLLVRAPRVDDTERDTLQLILDQLGTSLTTTVLTEELKSAAERDALTGVLNRGRLEKELEAVEALKHSNPDVDFSVVLIDVIGLKQVNDQYGHEAGDRLICATADALMAVCRESDGLFRFGGDEFVILCRNSKPEGVTALKRRIESTIQNTRVPFETRSGGQEMLPIRLSLGAANSAQVPVREVLRQADERMYTDKKRWYREHERYR